MRFFIASAVMTRRAPGKRLIVRFSAAAAFILALSGTFILRATPAEAAGTSVDCGSVNLQDAINGAPAGSKLIVTGTCVGNFTIDQNLTLVGKDGAELDGNQDGSTLAIGAGATVLLSHLTVTGGAAVAYGAGILNDGQLTLRHCSVTGNGLGGASAYYGGGIYNDGTLIVRKSSITDNAAEWGGGVANSGTATLENTTVTGNTAVDGGGIYNVYNYMAAPSSLTLNSVTISGNTTTVGNGGGLDNRGTATVRQSTITNNQSGSPGGGINNTGTLAVHMTTVSDNTALTQGGGIDNSGTLVLDSSTVDGNTAGSAQQDYRYGGGILNAAGTATIKNSTVSGNYAGTDGGGIYVTSGTVTLENSTISSNTPDDCAPPGSVAGC